MNCQPSDSSQLKPGNELKPVRTTDLLEKLDNLLNTLDRRSSLIVNNYELDSSRSNLKDKRNYWDRFKDYWPLRKDSSLRHTISTDRHKHHCCCCHQGNIKTRTSKHQGVSYYSQPSFSNNIGTDNLKVKLNSIHPRVHCHSNLSVNTSLTDNSMIPNKVNRYKHRVDFGYGKNSSDQLNVQEALSRPIQNITKGDVVDIITHVVKFLCEAENCKYRENLADWKCILNKLQGIRPNRKTDRKENLEGKQSFDISSFTSSVKDVNVNKRKKKSYPVEASTRYESYSYRPHYRCSKRPDNFDSFWDTDDENDGLKHKRQPNLKKFRM